MLFSSIVFLFTFLPIILILYYLVPGKFKNPVLLAGSLVFYAWGEPFYIFLMILSILFNYISGLDIARHLNNRHEARKSLIFNVAVNLCILGFFKYEGFVLDSINSVLPVDIPYRELALPIGISFYTFQTLSYIIDVYRGNVRVQRNLLDFALYVSMFPQLIAGPIVKYADIQRQLRIRQESWGKFGDGALYFIRGLAKKVLIANTTGMIFTKVTSLGAADTSVLTAWLGCAAYTFQIYFDFSGYSDMALGLGKMFGFQFLKNFDYPYISKSITEFWRRWHISLSTWFKEYVYIPLGGNRAGTGKHVRNILVVWLLTGLWHGASWNFVVWGLYYGILLLAEKYLLYRVLERLPGFLRHVYSIVLVMVGWVFFFSPTLGSAVQYLKLMFGGGSGLADKEGFYLLVTNLVLWAAAVIGSTPAVHDLYERFVYGSGKNRIAVNCTVYGILFLLCIAYLVTETYNPFLYFRF
ncbi:MBOAT family O-acyltransferase [[Clostridium] hylemonae]|uniref:MBOAT family protein n=1 Tax=[Clostridium] hylemonae DSM 15053 TaxID=553973 RepID=C0BZU6_9FIRM|nr:MBOAT family O-acyltransferase [[Clostridium] hylemonae]EEG74674.1 MBOAT family protein [[Clostridium] hylemonae DSM 15053]QEK18696.1 Peptidoglycan O-acetyltransferase [[Clostridium] hylemonae DSM 15053]